MESKKIFMLIFYFILLYIFIHTYYYLDQINNCVCFQKDGKYVVNIDFMKFFQLLEIFILTIFVSSIIFFNSNFFKIKKIKIPMPILSLVVLLMVGISLYMTINVINLYMNIKEDCKCVNSWYRFFLYYEGITSLITVFRFFVIIFLLIMVLFLTKFN